MLNYLQKYAQNPSGQKYAFFQFYYFTLFFARLQYFFENFRSIQKARQTCRAFCQNIGELLKMF